MVTFVHTEAIIQKPPRCIIINFRLLRHQKLFTMLALKYRIDPSPKLSELHSEKKAHFKSLENTSGHSSHITSA